MTVHHGVSDKVENLIRADEQVTDNRSGDGICVFLSLERSNRMNADLEQEAAWTAQWMLPRRRPEKKGSRNPQ